jgi:hypothetical protein
MEPSRCQKVNVSGAVVVMVSTPSSSLKERSPFTNGSVAVRDQKSEGNLWGTW